ncbi:MAG: TonB-dependent receptor [bacterium]
MLTAPAHAQDPAPAEAPEAPAAEAPAAEAPAAEAPTEAPAPDPSAADPSAADPSAADAPAGLPEGFEPPKLTREVQPVYPPEAQARKLAGDVVLLLTIDEEGAVSDAQIVQSVDPLLDQAALEAGMQLEFTPARMNGEPTPVQLQYRYGFTFTEERTEVAAPVDAEKPVGVLQGRLLERGTRKPLPGIRVQLKGQDREAYTGADGAFRFDDVPAGPAIIYIEDPVYTDLEDEETVTAGEETTVTYRLDRESFGDTLQVYAQRPKKEVVRRTITVEEIRTIPGTNGDALQVVQNVPGVARTPFGQSDIILRGGGNTQVYLNQQPIPLAFHFGGIRSTVASALIESIDVYPGNFDVEYGRVSGGVVDVRLRAPRTDGIHGYVEADVFDAGALVEGPLGENGGLAVAIRRSYFDGLLAAAPLPDSFTITTAPRWYDGQILYDYREGPHRVRALLYGSSDRFETVIEEPPEQNTLIRGNAVANLEWAGGQLEYELAITDKITHRANLAYLWTGIQFGVGEILGLDFTFHNLLIRDSITAALTDDLTLRVGIDVNNQWAAIDAVGAGGPPREGENQGGFGIEDFVSVEVDTFEANCAAYTAAEYKLGPVLIIPGVRFDVFSAIDDYRLQPRLSARWTVTDGTTIKGGVGQYVEPPDGQDTAPQIGNPTLIAEDSLHYSLGVEQQFTDAISLDITGYYKTFDDLITRATPLGAADAATAAAADAGPTLLNQGEGRSYGIEVLLRHDLSERFFGWISYTLQRSERRDRPGEDYRLFDFDQTHNLIIIGQYKLTPKWTVGFRWRTVSGNPDTPVIGAVFNTDNGTYTQLSGETNSARQPTFHQLDLRVDREWTFDTWRLIGYLDLRNATNRANAAGFQYNYDYTERTQAYEIPIIPSFGLRGEF